MFWATPTDWTMQALTMVMGLFFFSSGLHKALFRSVHDKMDGMFAQIGAKPLLPVVIGGELFGGLALMMGFLVPIAALGLIAILAGAICLVCWPEVQAKHPKDALDWMAKAIYMPEGLMSAVLVAITLAGDNVDHTRFWLGLVGVRV